MNESGDRKLKVDLMGSMGLRCIAGKKGCRIVGSEAGPTSRNGGQIKNGGR